MTKPITVIDGDIIAFKCSAANEVRSIKALHKPSARSKIFKHRTELKELIGDKFPISDFEIMDVQECEDISHALYSVKHMINSICKACGTDKYEIYFSGPNNFRDKIPYPTPYKGNREGMIKPLQLREVMEYLIERHGAIVVQGEADDKICERQWDGLQSGQKIIGCSTDKDSYGTEGWIYNWDKMDKPFLVKGLGKLWVDDKSKVWGIGYKWKALQWICGDKVDGLNPTHLCKVKYGEKSAYKLLVDLRTEDEVNKAVHDLYLKWYPEDMVYTDCFGEQQKANYMDIAQMYFDGIHMRRFAEDKPDVRDIWSKA